LNNRLRLSARQREWFLMKKTKKWRVYILKCSDGSLYTGITTDLVRRIHEHNQGKGAKYTRSRLPVEILYFERYPDRSSASKEEARIKKLNRKEKLYLIEGWNRNESQ
jgi:putative endonuclease